MKREEDKRKNYSASVWYREKARLSRCFQGLKASAATSRLDGSANGALHGIDKSEGVDK